MNKLKFSFLFLLLAIGFSACTEENTEEPIVEPTNSTNGKTTAVFNPALTYGTMTDQDGNVYKTIKIGNQTWMAENLRTTKFNDGTAIPNVTDGTVWKNLTTAAYCSYNNTNDEIKIATYGVLYNWYTVNTGKLAPKGWHVPTHEEWETLTTYLGGERIAGKKMKEIGNKHWISTSTIATNESGFSALPAGAYQNVVDMYIFRSFGDQAFFWSSTQSEYTVNEAWERRINDQESDCFHSPAHKLGGFSVRLIKD